MDVKSLATGSTVMRRLGALEQLYWLYDTTTPFHFVMAAEVEGQTQTDAWRNALDRLQQRHPLFRASVRQGPDKDLYFVSDDAARIPLRVVADENVLSWEQEAAVEMSTRFQPGDAPLLRATVVLRPAGAVLMLAVHHAIADGVSIAHTLTDLLRLMADEPLDAATLSPSLEDLVSGAPVDEAGNDKLTLRGLTVPDSPAAQADDRPVPSVRSLRLSSEHTARLLAAARRNGTTLHATLCAALVFAGRRHVSAWQEAVVRILSPINLRGFVGLDRRPVLAIGVSVQHAPPDGPHDFWQVARALKSELSESQSGENLQKMGATIGRLVARGLDASEAAEFMIGHFASEATVTNLGLLSSAKRYDHLSLKAVWGPSVLTNAPGEQVIGASTFDGCLQLLHTSLAPHPSLLQEIQAVLQHAAGIVTKH